MVKINEISSNEKWEEVKIMESAKEGLVDFLNSELGVSNVSEKKEGDHSILQFDLEKTGKEKKNYSITLGNFLESEELFQFLKDYFGELEVVVEKLEEESEKDEESPTKNSTKGKEDFDPTKTKGKEDFDPTKTKGKEDFDPTKIRNILLIGRTGNGKSALANVITGMNKFKESELAVSETKDAQAEVVGIDGVGYRIVDTIGIGDTKLDEKEVLLKIAQATRMVKEGLNQVLFVTSGRFTESEIEAYNILRTVIFDQDIVRYTTIVRTKFAGFRSPERTEADKKALVAENEKLADVINRCNKILYVNNPTINVGDEEQDRFSQKIREQSRIILSVHLSGCLDVYKPENLDKINERIGKHADRKQELVNSIDELKKQLEEQKNLSKQERAQLMEQLSAAKQQTSGVNEQISNELLQQLKIQSEEYLKKIEEIGKQNQDEINKMKEEYRSQLGEIQKLREQEAGDNKREIEKTNKYYKDKIKEINEQNRAQIRAMQEQAPKKKSGFCPIS